VEITPPALKNIGYKTYIIFAVFNLVNSLIVWCFYPETAGKKLEEMDQLFLGDWEDQVGNAGIDAFRSRLQWDVVRRSMESNDFLKRPTGDGLIASALGVS